MARKSNVSTDNSGNVMCVTGTRLQMYNFGFMGPPELSACDHLWRTMLRLQARLYIVMPDKIHLFYIAGHDVYHIPV